MLDDKYINLIIEKLENIQDNEFKELIYMLIKDNLKLQKESIVDPLSGLYNRRILEKLNIVPAIAIMCDIDNFKEINDIYGHDKGDYVIKGIGKILKENFRSTDYVCRLGGDEFLILLNDYCSERFILERCEKLKCEILEKIILPNHKVTLSIGVALDNNCNKFDELIKKADESLYKSKNSGKDQVNFDDEFIAKKYRKLNK